MDFPGFDPYDNIRILSELDVGCVRKNGVSRDITFCTGYEDYAAPRTMAQIEKLLAPYGFIRIDRNKIVNTTKVDKYVNGVVTVGLMRFSVSRERQPAFERLYYGKRI
jgi:DNA-binding LytR/AlgR family response regulator